MSGYALQKSAGELPKPVTSAGVCGIRFFSIAFTCKNVSRSCIGPVLAEPLKVTKAAVRTATDRSVGFRNPKRQQCSMRMSSFAKKSTPDVSFCQSGSLPNDRIASKSCKATHCRFAQDAWPTVSKS